MDERVSDAELVARALGGDLVARTVALETLATRYYEVAISAAYIVLKDPERAKDCAQDAFIEAIESLIEIRERAKFGQWLYGVARRKAIYALRHDKLDSKAMRGKSDADRAAATPASPHEQANNNEKAASIRRALNDLDEIYREVLVLKYIDGRGLEDIAELLDVSLAAVDKRLMRGEEMLRESLKRWRDG